MPKPHGGRLVERVLAGEERQEALARARSLPAIAVHDELAHEIYNLAHGVYSPLEGFMGSKDLARVLRDRRLDSGLPWTVPIVLDVDADCARDLAEGKDVVLAAGGRPLALLHLEEKHLFDRDEYARQVFGTTDAAHPGVAKVNSLKDVLLAGPVDLLAEPEDPYASYRLTPRETRVLFKSKGWRTVVGFQTRNVPHVGHEYVQKTALTFVDGLFINPVIGKKKAGDFKDEVILETHQALMDHYYLRNRAVMSIWHYEMKYAGPREAILHAIVRKNFGCSHFIVGRDHAGVGKYYSPYAAQEIFEDFPDLGIVPLFFTAFFYCHKCGGVANEKTCPHGEDQRLNFSGTLMRQALSNGQHPPTELVRPEVAEICLKCDAPFVA